MLYKIIIKWFLKFAIALSHPFDYRNSMSLFLFYICLIFQMHQILFLFILVLSKLQAIIGTSNSTNPYVISISERQMKTIMATTYGWFLQSIFLNFVLMFCFVPPSRFNNLKKRQGNVKGRTSSNERINCSYQGTISVSCSAQRALN